MDLLYVHWHVSPEIFHIGPVSIRWYGLLFVAGFILGFYIFEWFCKREKLSEKILDPLLVTLMVGTIVGARLGHCLFYQPSYYFGSWQGFWEISSRGRAVSPAMEVPSRSFWRCGGSRTSTGRRTISTSCG